MLTPDEEKTERERLQAEVIHLRSRVDLLEHAFMNGKARAYEEIEEARKARKDRCVDKCNHSADFICDYEDGTSHCLECLADKWWQIEDILSGKHNVHAYWGALEAIAHPERYLAKYDPVELARKALGNK
jgi:hypothetical protein